MNEISILIYYINLLFHLLTHLSGAWYLEQIELKWLQHQTQRHTAPQEIHISRYFLQKIKFIYLCVIIDTSPPIDEVIAAGAIPVAMRYLEDDNYTVQVSKMIFLCLFYSQNMKVEAAWILTNIASGNESQTTSLCQQGALPALLKCLSSSNVELVEQCIWAVGNVSGMQKHHLLTNT